MKHYFKTALFYTALFAMIQPAYGQKEFCGGRNTSFKEHEKLVYRVFYNMGVIWINAGNVNFNITSETLGSHKVFHIIGDGKTAKAYEWVFKVKDRYETFLDKETMLPMKFVRDVREGSIRIKNNVKFNQKKGIAISDTTTYTIPQCTQDVLSAIYYARNIDYSKYQPGDRIPFNMFLDNQNYSLYIKYLGKEVLSDKAGEYKTIKIAPLLIDGTIFKGGDKMVVWVSDDDNHIPLRIASPILVGTIKVDLLEYENLRNPFSSLIREY